ncbi:MAG: hypothetical protein WBA86_01075 [Nodosilinea sp.]
MIKHIKSAKLLALFSGASILSFGVSYQVATQWMKGGSPDLINVKQMAVIKRSSGLHLKSIEQALRQANFRFLTTSAYSLVGPTATQSAAFEAKSATDG